MEIKGFHHFGKIDKLNGLFQKPKKLPLNMVSFIKLRNY